MYILAKAIPAVFTFLCCAVILYAALVWSDRPDVHISYSSGECVKVVDHKAEHYGLPSQYSCNNLPKSYVRVWVQ